MFNLILLFMLNFGNTQPSQPNLTVEITNLRSAGGTLRVAVYKPGGNFGKSKPDFYKNVFIKQPGNVKVDFELVPGKYAIAVYHDLNDNDQLDKNLVGYPREPFGFSNNYRPIVSGPKFEDCAIELTEQGASLSIKLID